MRFVLALCFFGLGILPAQTPASSDNWRAVLQEVRRSVVDAINRSDNYICVQDLSRFYYSTPSALESCHQPPETPSAPLQANDRLKLDVAVSEGVEIYSWHGEHKFSGGNVAQLVHQGPIASGSFNGYLRNVFGDAGVRFTYTGRNKLKGLDLYNFNYEVPLAASHYQVQAGSGMERVPFHGSFAARADNLELYSLVVTANGNSISKRSNICAVQSSVTYQTIPIGNHESLLPKSFDLMMGTRQLLFTDSKGIYSECREYTGESRVRFEDSDSVGEIATPTMADTEPLKPGIFFQIALQGTIDEDSAYAGQPVEAILVRRAKIGKGRTLQRGAKLHGTLTGFQIHNAPHHVMLNIEFSSIVDGKDLYVCNAIHQVPLTLPRAGRFPRFEQEDQNDGSIVFNTSHLHLDDRFKSVFVTVDHADTESR